MSFSKALKNQEISSPSGSVLQHLSSQPAPTASDLIPSEPAAEWLGDLV